MRNWFYINGNLDRSFLRSSAVYRCLKRYDVSEDWAIEKLTSVMNKNDATALVQSWRMAIRKQQ